MDNTEPVLDSQGNDSPFAPSLMTQANSLLENAPPSSTLGPVEYKPEDLEGIFSMPFDAAAFITKVDDLELTKKELDQLTRIWAKPFGALSARYPNFPWIMAGTLTMGIIVEKVLIYYIAMDARNKEKKRLGQEANNAKASKVEENPSTRASVEINA